MGAPTDGAQLWAGAAKVDITAAERPADASPLYAGIRTLADDSLYVKALVLDDGLVKAILITIDAVAVGEIGTIESNYVGKVRGQIEKELGIAAGNVLITASHCHGLVCADLSQRTLQAVREACRNMSPVKIGAGSGHEDRIMENRRLRLKNGAEADVRQRYPLPPDEEVAAIGPVDPEIGILRIDRESGGTLAVVYHFACHPILGIPNKGNTADFPGFASKIIEETLGDGATALFVQGCAGDINPVLYKDVGVPRNAQPLGTMLGLSVLRALRSIPCSGRAELRLTRELLDLPRSRLLGQRIGSLQAEQAKLLESLIDGDTSLNLKTFIPLYVKYGLSAAYPADYAHRYLHESARGVDSVENLDAENRANLRKYVSNVHAMEELTRLQENITLLKKHRDRNESCGYAPVKAEIIGLKIGEFSLVTFPGELSVRTGLKIKKANPSRAIFIAGYTNGYLYYAPTAEQLDNPGHAQEDCDCILDRGWERLYEESVARIAQRLWSP